MYNLVFKEIITSEESIDIYAVMMLFVLHCAFALLCRAM